MSVLRRCGTGMGLMLWVFLAGGFVLAQGDIDFGDVPVGETKTATYTFEVRETSSTPGIVTQISAPEYPFELQNLPALPAAIKPGDSISFQVAFSPSEAWTYVSNFTIAVEGGTPPRSKKWVITVIGRGVIWPPVPQPKPRTVLEIAPKVAELVSGNTEFAFDLYQAVRAREGNLLYSPYSVSLALAMAYAGARDTTE